jgi:transcriptional regulator with XRE-family HTH domain
VTDLGPRLKAARKERKWTLREAERRSGVPNAHIAQVEGGTIRHPGMSVLTRLAVAYGVPLHELVALGGCADFGTVGRDGRLKDREGHDLWRMSVYLPEGREGEAVAWMQAHGLEVYRMQKVGEVPAKAAERAEQR